MTNDLFSRQLQKLRRQQGMTQEQLAHRLGVSPQAVSKWENGSYPDGDLIPMLADLFGVTISYLYGREEEKTSAEQIIMDEIKAMMTPENKNRSDPNSHPEVAERMRDLIWAMMIAPWANNKIYYPPVEAEPGIATAAVLADNASFNFMCLNPDNRFFIQSIQPEQSVPDVNGMTELFRLLGDRDMLSLLRFMLTLSTREYVSPSVAGEAAGISAERAEKLLRSLCIRPKWNSLIQTVQNVGPQGAAQTLYGIDHNTAGLLVGLFQLTRVILDPPDGYQMQIGMRSRGYGDREASSP